MDRKRRRKKSDQNETEQAYQVLQQAMLSHPEIEQTLWAGACWTALVTGYLNSGISWEGFCNDFENAKNHYAKWLDK